MTERRLAVIGYLVLAVGVSLGLYFTVQNTRQITNERAERSLGLNGYLTRSCARDKDKDAIFISILSNAVKHTRATSNLTPQARRNSIHSLEVAIEGIKAIDVRCVRDIPPPIPKH